MDENKNTDISDVDKQVSEMSNLEKLEVMQNFATDLTQNSVELDADIVDDYFDALYPLDISLCINNLLKLENNWYEGQGKALNKEHLTKFRDLFNSYFDNELPLPAIFPKIDGNIQLEWKKENKNIVLDVNLNSLLSDFFYYNSVIETDEKEELIALNDKDEWRSLNKLIKTYIL